MNDLKVTVSSIRFEVEGVEHKFDIVHNMPNNIGLRIEDAVNSWVYRTKDFTAQSLCDYINSKNGHEVAVPRHSHDDIFSYKDLII